MGLRTTVNNTRGRAVPTSLSSQPKNKKHMNHLEALTADTFLQNPVELTIGKEKMMVSKPTFGTLVEASKYIALLPELEETNWEQAISYAFANAEKSTIIGDILAILILGRHAAAEVVVTKKRGLFGWARITIKKRREILAERILDECSCEDIMNILTGLIGLNKLAFFLKITAFLRETNLLRKTKKEE